MGNFDKAMAAIEKKIGKKNETIIYDPKRPVVSASTGSIIIDGVTGVGGLLVKRRLTEVFGAESSGKTTVSLQSAAMAQAKGWVGAFIDVEQAYDAAYAKALGLKLDNKTFIVLQPQFAEEAEQTIDVLLDNVDKIDYLLIDGIAAMKPKLQIEAEDSTGKGQVKGAHAQFMANWMPKMNILAQQHDIAILFTNQLRRTMSMGGMFAPKAVRGRGLGSGYNADDSWVTTGGETVKYYMSMRFLLDYRKGYKEEVNGEEVKVANIITLSNVKNKLSEPYTKADFMIRYGVGTDDSVPVFLALTDFGYITKKPNTSQYTFDNEDDNSKARVQFTENGYEKFMEALVNNPKHWAAAQKLYLDLVSNRMSSVSTSSDEDDEEEEDLDED